MKGHTQMDGDSMHSTIENAARYCFIFTQNQWIDIIKNAKNKEPKYFVHEINQEEILDFSMLSNKKSWKSIKISQLSEITF